jgi:hypothetical protein
VGQACSCNLNASGNQPQGHYSITSFGTSRGGYLLCHCQWRCDRDRHWQENRKSVTGGGAGRDHLKCAHCQWG